MLTSCIGRYGASAAIGSRSSTVSRSITAWNQKFGNDLCQRILSNSTRRYTIAANHSPFTMMPSHSQRGTKFTTNIIRSFSLRDFASSLWSLVAVPRPITMPPIWNGITTATRETTVNSPKSSSIFDLAIWLIKRTYQPSLLKKKRQCGYMKRRQSVGGRRILKRRRKKGRKRLFGA